VSVVASLDEVANRLQKYAFFSICGKKDCFFCIFFLQIGKKDLFLQRQNRWAVRVIFYELF